MDHAVDSAETRTGRVDDRAQASLVGHVGFADEDFRARSLLLLHGADPLARRIRLAALGDVIGPRLARGQAPSCDQHELRLEGFRQIARDHHADAAEATGQEVHTALAQTAWDVLRGLRWATS